MGNKIPVNCSTKSCPVYSKCCFLPTEYYLSDSGKVHILFVGQGGGTDERKQKRPFVGKAGVRLRSIVFYLRNKLKMKFGVAFSNTIRDNPEGNRPPAFDEVKCCMPYLYRDIVSLKKLGLNLIVPLGVSAKRTIIPSSLTSMSDHGSVYYTWGDNFGKMLCVPTYHPSFLLRTMGSKFKISENPQGNKKDYNKIAADDISKALFYAYKIKEYM